MAKYKFYNVAKANAEIDRLEAENAKLKAASPATDESATQLADAMATNEQVSAELAETSKQLGIANQKVSTGLVQLEKAQGEVNALGAAIKTACTTLKIEIPANATSTEMVTLMQNSIPGLASKKALEITASGGTPGAPSVASDAKDPKTAGKPGMARILSAAKADLTAAGYVTKAK